MARYHRLGHMQFTPVVKIGQWVRRGDDLGRCGSTGNSTGPHCHYDIPLVNLGPRWTRYVYGMTLKQVANNYANPKAFCDDNIPMRAQYPLLGYTYLQPVRGKYGVYYHPGNDLNGADDLGKIIKSPVEGRVIHVAGMPAWLPKSAQRFLNGGWGNFVVIEEKPGFIL